MSNQVRFRRWTVRIINPQATETLTASEAIQRIHGSGSSSTSLLYSPEGSAQKGQWYDALTALQNLIQANRPAHSTGPLTRTSRAHRSRRL